MTTPTLYERLGGEPAIDAAVDIFYKKILLDDTINHFFKDIDMDKQVAKQKGFLTMAFGGPKAYSGKHMRHAHKNIDGLTGAHFDSVVNHLATTLKELGVTDDLIGEVATIANSVRSDVLNLTEN